MKRRWNLLLWLGFLLVLIGLLSYVPFFIRFPLTRDFPWANLLLQLAGAVLLSRGLARAFKQPRIYRGKISGSVVAALSLAGIGMFAYGLLYQARQIPSAAAAPRVGQNAPDFLLPDQNGQLVTLASLLKSGADNAVTARTRAVLLIFYRGHW